MVNGQTTMIIFESQMLVFERTTESNSVKAYQTNQTTTNIDFKTSVGIGIRLNTQNVYGMASREENFSIQDTRS